MDLDDEKWLDDRPRRLVRSRTDKLIFGVCGGIGDYYRIEPIWVRLVFIFLSVTSAFVLGPILYIALAILMPKVETEEGPADLKKNIKELAHEVGHKAEQLRRDIDEPRLSRRRTVLGLGIIIVGIIAFFNEIFPNFWIGWKVLWPIIIMLIGLSFISDSRPGRRG